MFVDPAGKYFVDESFKEDTETNLKGNENTLLVNEIGKNSLHTQSSKFARHMKPPARNYCIDLNICTQFPDQFKPFFSLPLGVEEAIMTNPNNANSSYFKGTIIRIPFRNKDETTPSNCHLIFDNETIGTLTKTIKSCLPSSLIFTNHLHTIKVNEWSNSANSFKPILRSKVTSSLLSRQNYFDDICNNTRWRKDGESRIKKLFKSSWVPMKTSHILEISHRHDEEDGDIIDTFIVVTIIQCLQNRKENRPKFSQWGKQ